VLKLNRKSQFNNYSLNSTYNNDLTLEPSSRATRLTTNKERNNVIDYTKFRNIIIIEIKLKLKMNKIH
jgi:hypothetical protein